MANLNEIKKILYKEKPIAKQTAIYRDGGSKDYEALTSLGLIKFHVPKDNNDSIMAAMDDDGRVSACLLIDYIKM